MPKWLKGLLVLAFWLVIWQLVALAVGSDLLFPGPWTVAAALVSQGGTAVFWQITVTSLLRVFGGLAAGVVLGTAVAALTCASRWCDALLSPAVKVVRATPVASFILLVLLWVTTGLVPVVIAALMVLRWCGAMYPRASAKPTPPCWSWLRSTALAAGRP